MLLCGESSQSLLLQLGGDAPSGIELQNGSDGEAHYPLVALGSEHEHPGKYQEHGTNDLLAAQPTDDEVLAFVTGLDHLYPGKQYGTYCVDVRSQFPMGNL